MFQYKILHDIVFTKEKLFRANVANSDLCCLCLETKQDLKHMLVSCQFVLEFWEAFLYWPWYKSRVSTGLELSTINILYGIIGNNHLNKLTNHLLLLFFFCISLGNFYALSTPRISETNINLYLFYFPAGAVEFTVQPGSTKYFMKGSNATLIWDYKVDNWEAELRYIIWRVRNKTSTIIYPLLYEDNKGNVTISRNIPQIYVGRVRKIGRATLVIENLTYEDTTRYICFLDKISGEDPSSSVELVITGTGF